MKFFDQNVDLVKVFGHFGTKACELCVHVGAKHLESGVHGVIVVVNHGCTSLGKSEIVGGMERSVTQAVLWVSSTEKSYLVVSDEYALRRSCLWCVSI